jgi:hypothetical protein|eukprot:COSAG01_NODE_825_length_13294_cov_30.659038_4_plen_69_part_00
MGQDERGVSPSGRLTSTARFRAERQSSPNAIMVACATVVVVAYISRASLSVMIVSMSEEYGWTRDEVR